MLNDSVCYSSLTETGVEEAPSVVNYEIDTTHVHSLVITQRLFGVWLPRPTIVSSDPNKSGMQVRMKRGHLLLSRVPIWREIKVCAWGRDII